MPAVLYCFLQKGKFKNEKKTVSNESKLSILSTALTGKIFGGTDITSDHINYLVCTY